MGCSSLVVAAFAFSLTQTSDAEQDREILELGHRAWIARNATQYPGDTNALFNAEVAFANAVGRRNLARVEASPERRRLEEVQMWLANLTKCAARISDYLTAGTPKDRVYTARAHVSVNLAFEGFLGDRLPKTRPVRQADLWSLYRETKVFHRQNEAKIAEFARVNRGYDVPQHFLEYGSLGDFITSTMKAIAKAPQPRREAIIGHCYRMVALTRGDDPLQGLLDES